MSNKSKGSNAERELYQMFVDNHYRAVRVAGSGVMENADCDIIAGKKGKKYCIEAKSSKKPVKYISKEQINNFITFSEIFGLKPIIAVRFNRLGWFFLNPKDMEDSGKNWVINEETARKKGDRFAQFFGEKINNKEVSGENKSLKINNDIVLDEKELDMLTGADY
jgi:holliday junction resolvase Hjr